MPRSPTEELKRALADSRTQIESNQIEIATAREHLRTSRDAIDRSLRLLAEPFHRLND